MKSKISPVFIASILLFASLLTPSFGLSSNENLFDDWTSLYQGVQYRLIESLHPEALRVHQMKIDLSNPNVKFMVTPSEPTSNQTKSLKTSSFLQHNQLQVAINGTGYGPANNEPEGSLKSINAFAVSQGKQYGRKLYEDAAFIVLNNGDAKIISSNEMEAYKDDISEALGGWSMEGSALLVISGQVNDALRLGGEKNARTAIGISENQKTVYLVVVETGPRSGFWYKDLVSVGVTIEELAIIMQDLGCFQALNLDGGGSSTMAISDLYEQPILLNLPSDYSETIERSVGNHLGIYAKPFPLNDHINTLIHTVLSKFTEQNKKFINDIEDFGVGLQHYQRETKRYDPQELNPFIQEFCETKFPKDTFFQLSDLKSNSKKPSGVSKGGVYRDKQDVVWFVKEGQKPINEYLGSKIMDLLVGPAVPEVKLIQDTTGHTASKHMLKFLQQDDVKESSSNKPIIGQIKLGLAMDLIALSDRHGKNMGYTEQGDKLLASRVDFDHCFEFEFTNNGESNDIFKEALSGHQAEDISVLEEAINELLAIPDYYILKVFNDRINELLTTEWISLSDIKKYKELGPEIIERKQQLPFLLNKVQRWKALFSQMQSNPEVFTKEMFDEIENLTNSIFGRSNAFLAVEQNNLDMLQAFIKQGIDINLKNSQEESLLHEAAKLKTLDIIQFLLDQGIDINIKNSQNATPVHIAAASGNMNLLKFLIEKGADLDAKDTNNATVLHYATYSANVELIKFLLDGGADINAIGGYEKASILLIVAQSGDFELAKFLIEKGADIQVKNNNGYNFLTYVVGYSNLEMLEFLVTEKAINLNEECMNNGYTPLHLAAEYANIDIIKFLIKHNADIHAKNQSGDAVIHLAASSGDLDKLKYFIESGADVHVKGPSNKSILHYAVESDRSNLEIVKFLVLEKVIDVNLKDDSSNETALHKAIHSGNLNIVKFLIQHGADLSSNNNRSLISYATGAISNKLNILKFLVLDKGIQISADDTLASSYLTVAIQSRDLDILKFFLENGVDFNHPNIDKPILLNQAVTFASLEIVKFLVLEKGIDVNVKTGNDEETPLLIAARYGNLDIIKFLTEKGADPLVVSKDNKNVLHYAVQYNTPNVNILKFFLKQKDIDVNLKSTLNDETPLLNAARSGNLNVVKFLIDNGADINALSKDNKNALHFAAESSTHNLDLIKFLILEHGMNINAKSDSNEDALIFLPVKSGNLKILKFLIDNGADLLSLSRDGKNLLHYAVDGYERLEMVKFLLLQKDFDINAKGGLNDETPLLLAIKNGDLSLIQFLIDNGADFNVLSKDNKNILHYAVEVYNNPLQLIKYLVLEKGVDVNVKAGSNDETALLRAAQSGKLDLVKFLLENDADINATTKDNKSILHYAIDAYQNSFEILKFLVIQKNINLNIKGDYNNVTPLQKAIASGKIDIAKLLIDNGADVHIKGGYNEESLLHFAVSSGNLDSVKSLIKAGIDVNAKDKYNVTPLQKAMASGKIDVAKLLIDNGADINIKGEFNEESLLHFAVSSGNLDSVKFLIEAGVDVNEKGRNNKTSLYQAVESEKLDIAKLLIDNGADVYIKVDYNEKSLLHSAASSGKIGLVKFLLENGVDVNVKNKYHETPLYEAVNSNKLDMAKLLIDNGADVNAKNNYNQTPLYEAVNSNKLDMAKLLIDNGADINTKEGSNEEPLLHSAVVFGRLEFVKFLIEAGLDVNVRDKNNATLLHSSIRSYSNRLEIAQFLLLRKDIDINIKDDHENKTVLYKALESKNFDIAKLIIENGADVNIECGYSEEPVLHIVAESNNLQFTKFLLENGADVNLTGKYGDTALNYAIGLKTFGIAKLLVENGADVNINLQYSLRVAIDHESLDIVNFLIGNGANIKNGYKAISLDFIKLHHKSKVLQYLESLSD